MATLPIRAPLMPPLAGFARIVSFVQMMIAVFSEAQQQAVAAHKRYPFADW
jgi:hypothetical protein